jgi:hypothetical protein
MRMTTVSRIASDLETRLVTKRPPSERNAFADFRNSSSTKFGCGHVNPELQQRQFTK